MRLELSKQETGRFTDSDCSNNNKTTKEEKKKLTDCTAAELISFSSPPLGHHQ